MKNADKCIKTFKKHLKGPTFHEKNDDNCLKTYLASTSIFWEMLNLDIFGRIFLFPIQILRGCSRYLNRFLKKHEHWSAET